MYFLKLTFPTLTRSYGTNIICSLYYNECIKNSLISRLRDGFSRKDRIQGRRQILRTPLSSLLSWARQQQRVQQQWQEQLRRRNWWGPNRKREKWSMSLTIITFWSSHWRSPLYLMDILNLNVEPLDISQGPFIGLFMGWLIPGFNDFIIFHL